MINGFQDLRVWQKAMDLTVEVYRIARKLPREELYALSDQMKRAAVSIPSNIAEGQARKSTKEFVNYLSMARGSNAELQTQCLLCNKLSYLSKDEIKTAISLSEEVGKMLSMLMKSLSTNH